MTGQHRAELVGLVEQLDRMAEGVRRAIPASPRRRRRRLEARAEAFGIAAGVARTRLERADRDAR